MCCFCFGFVSGILKWGREGAWVTSGAKRVLAGSFCMLEDACCFNSADKCVCVCMYACVYACNYVGMHV